MAEGKELVKATSSSLDTLWVTVEREHAAVSAAVSSALDHAIAAGSALLEAQAALREGSFQKWVEGRGLSYRTAQKYMRLATHKKELAEAPVASVTQADHFLRGLPRRLNTDEAMVAEVKRLHAEGLGSRKIAERVGVSRSTVLYHTDPNFRDRKTKGRNQSLQASRVARRNEETERRLREHGGPIFEGYRLVQQAEVELQESLVEAESSAEQWDLKCAIDCLHEAEDRIARAIRSDLPVPQRTRVRSAHPDVEVDEGEWAEVEE